MKLKIFRLGIIGLCLFALTSCNKEYLETSPTNQVGTGDAFSNVTNAWAALNGIHRIMYTASLGTQSQGGQSGNILIMDIMGEDLVFPNLNNNWLRQEYQWIYHRNTSSRATRHSYLFYYIVIGNANMIIANIDGAEGPEADKAYIKGQALAYRAWSYFQMIQLFGERYEQGGDNSGMGLSLVLEPDTKPIPRNSVEEVYTQIETDLKEAATLLDGYDRGGDKSQIDLSVVKGYQARVALTKQDYANAATYAREAREAYQLMSNDDYMSGFNNYDNVEWMWSSRITADQTNSFYNFFAHMALDFTAAVIRNTPKVMNSKLYAEITDTDIRKNLWDPTGEDVENFPLPNSTFRRYPYLSRKFLAADPALSIGDVPYMRAAEMYLIEAEALAASNQTSEAADVLYELAVNRDPAYSKSSNTGQDLVDEILIQRRVELWGEGFRFYDLKRLNQPLDRTGANHNATYAVKMTEPAGTIEWQFLIPQNEINNSGGVVIQNPQ